MADLKLRWALGIDNISSKTNLPMGAVKDAVNIDIDRAGTLGRRRGRASVAAVDGGHSLWTAPASGVSFAVLDGWLCRVQMPWQVTQLHQLETDAPCSFEEVNELVYCSSVYELLAIDSAFNVRKVGLERPGRPFASAAAFGGLTAGDYGVAVSYMRGNEEGPLSRMANVTLNDGEGITLVMPQPTEALPDRIRVYRTQPNGDVLFRTVDMALDANIYSLGITQVGRQARNQFLMRMPPGRIVRHWRGRLWTVRENRVAFSEPLWHGVYDPRHNFVMFESPVRIFEPIDGGIYAGTKEGVFFLSGKGPNEFEVHKVGGSAPVADTAQRISTNLLAEDETYTGERAVIWLSENGFVIGDERGKITEKQRRRIKLYGTTGAVVVHDRRVTAVVL